MTDYLALAPTEGMSIAEVIETNTGGAGLDMNSLDRISVPTGGGGAWAVPGLDEEPEYVKELEVVVLAIRNVRVYYDVPFDGDRTPPACSSDNARQGYTADGEGPIDCASCKFAQWGSGRGNAQACKLRKIMLCLTKDNMLPVIVDIPPSSVGSMDKFLIRLAGRRTPYFDCEIALTLGKATSDSGIDYSKVEPKFIRLLEDEEKKTVAQYRAALGDMFTKVSHVSVEE